MAKVDTKLMWNPLFGGSAVFWPMGFNGTGTDNDSWTINEDAVAGLDEDSSLVLTGGDGTSLIAHTLEQDSGLGIAQFYKTVNAVEAGTLLSIGTRNQIVDLEQALEFAGGNGASPHIAKLRFSDTLGGLVVQEELPVGTVIATELQVGTTAGGSLRMTEIAADPADVANSGSLYVKDDAGDTELFFRSNSGVIQLTADGSISVGSIAFTLDEAYTDGRTIVNDLGPIIIDGDATTTGGALSITPDVLAETSPQVSIVWDAGAYTGTPHGLRIDLGTMTSLTNAADVYGIQLTGKANAGAGDSIGLYFAGSWNNEIESAGPLDIVAGGAMSITNPGAGASLTITADSASVWSMSGNSGANIALTIDAINAGAGEGQLYLNADDEVRLNDGTLLLTLDAGVVTETGMVSIDLTPSGAMTLRGGGVSQFGDDTAYWNFDGAGALTETGMTSVSITPSGNMTFTAGTTSIWSMSGSSASTLTLRLDAINAGAGEGHLILAANDRIIIGSAGQPGLDIFASYLQIADDTELRFGNTGTGDAAILWSTTETNDSLMIGVGNTSRMLILCEFADISSNFAHGNQTNPTLYIQSADHTVAADHLKLFHDQTDGNIECGAGNLRIIPPSGSYIRLEGQKTDTGDPTGAEGMIYVNTFDNAVRMYADGAWRSLATW